MEDQKSRSSPTVAFTYDWYRGFLERLRAAGFDFRTFSGAVGAGDVLLRHDVDLSMEKALATARIESELGIPATYCVLLTSPLYNPLEGERRDQIRAIEALGHDVALHFSTHEYWDAADEPDEATLTARVAEEREALGAVLRTPPETVSFHVPPAWVLGRPFDEFRNSYAPAYFDDIEYVADSGQCWRRAAPDVPGPPASVQILTHPGLWGGADAGLEDRVNRSVSDACAQGRTARTGVRGARAVNGMGEHV